MRIPSTILIAIALLLGLGAPATAQQLANDGFHRRNGQMHVLRNGQLRPMTRDSRLPTGTVVTKDGFLVAANGTRTELLEGQACDLKGRVVAVRPGAGGALTLGAPLPGRRAAPAAGPAKSAFEEFLGGSRKDREDDERRREDKDEDSQERAEQAREQQGREEKWLREQVQRYEEHGRGRRKKWKDKWKKGERDDD